ncbi:BAHD acyltransferase DCR-like [Eucalyptus grandis]|uniref:BAHD acyltransferase DCR-like n=1 Tax=Eucalyptus grandis TaxID=71139 RepID=UPI00192EACB0|nr:BAHD acyltransferase DCR-like [Eucalyptus grandis]
MRHHQYLILPVPDCPCMAVHRARPPLPAQPGHRLPDGCEQPGRLDPPLSPEYFGNSITPVRTAAKVGELLGSGLGWAARLLHTAVAEHSSAKLREWNEDWIKRPQVYHLDKTFDQYSIMMGSSPRFDKYGNEFGLGKAVALRSGYANKFDGKVSAYPGHEGGGSIDLEICLPPTTMALSKLTRNSWPP